MKFNNRILLIEDDDVDAMTLERALSDLKISYQLDRVTNGEEGLNFLHNPANPRPGIILLDINMPRMNGIEFLVELRMNAALKAIPVIILTTSQEEIDRLAAFDKNVAGYMVKPVDYLQFVKIVEIICNYWSHNQLPASSTKHSEYAK